MTVDELLSLSLEEVQQHYAKLADYVAMQCTGCSDSPMILSIKASKAMEEAHQAGENPIRRLNEFLGTSISEKELLDILSTMYQSKDGTLNKSINCIGDLKQNITYLIGQERAEGRIEVLSAVEISKRLNIPVEEIEPAMQELRLI